MKVAVIDYGMGNLGSVCRALNELGAQPFISSQPETLDEASRIILPGVGSFADGMRHLTEGGWVKAIIDQVAKNKPILGICLGMQLLATQGTESGDHSGLNLIPGDVQRLDILGCNQRIPHVGWNNINLLRKVSNLFTNIPNNTDFYFVHSYAFHAHDKGDVLAEVDYGIPVTAAISRQHVFGTQFHPEKSSKAGFLLIRNFLEYKSC